jgi:hypothetical protein
MGKKNSPIYVITIVIIFASLSCGLFSRVAGKDEPAAEPAMVEILHQWASSAKASSEYDNPD